MVKMKAARKIAHKQSAFVWRIKRVLSRAIALWMNHIDLFVFFFTLEIFLVKADILRVSVFYYRLSLFGISKLMRKKYDFKKPVKKTLYEGLPAGEKLEQRDITRAVSMTHIIYNMTTKQQEHDEIICYP